jgi:hypothetical protein
MDASLEEEDDNRFVAGPNIAESLRMMRMIGGEEMLKGKRVAK